MKKDDRKILVLELIMSGYENSSHWRERVPPIKNAKDWLLERRPGFLKRLHKRFVINCER